MIETFIDSFQFQIQKQSSGYKMNGQEINPRIQRVNEHLWKATLNDREFDIFIQKVDHETQEVTLSINGKKGTVKLESRAAKLLKSLGMENAFKKKIENVKAPMPGLIHSIMVNQGDQIEQGDPLFILEAMKMENVIKSSGAGIISDIHVKPKESVEKNQLLISFE